MKLDNYRIIEGQHLKLSELSTEATDKTSKEEAAVRKAALQLQLFNLQERLFAEDQQSLLVVLQTRDAGGKDGTIKHVFTGLNPQGVRVTGFKEPTELEQRHDFLWRVHAHTPETGMISIFNRSYYEDVLVTRVHGEIGKKDTEQRFEQIRAFEKALESRGTRIIKFYLNISSDEQKKRFQDRLDNPEKHWKFSQNDLNERKFWKEYTLAYEEAITATSTATAPWYVIPADQKWFRNDLVLQILLKTLEEMNPQFPVVDFDPKSIVID
ncbi:PPK2 family polyphosphate kinase [Deinococcus oregonensis]|uniref:PPK2 family polyphosphate kinase n=1 Tax=Deinococcus oregonensis TaxID=1805970 RepID=A0ABV6B5G6_9DEIO